MSRYDPSRKLNPGVTPPSTEELLTRIQHLEAQVASMSQVYDTSGKPVGIAFAVRNGQVTGHQYVSGGVTPNIDLVTAK